MEKFLEYIEKTDGRVYESKKNIERVLRLLNIDNFIDLMAEMPNFNLIIEKLLDKYTLGTTLNILDTLRILSVYYDADKIYMYRFIDEYNNLLDLKENKDMYSKFSIFEVKKKIESIGEIFLTHQKSYTQIRNFLVLYLFIVEFPLRLTNWTKIKLVHNNFEFLDEFDDYPFYLVIQNNDFYFIFNKFEEGYFTGQYIHKITNKVTYGLLSRFLIHMKNTNHYFITNKSGKPISNPNLSNAITNFTKETFGKVLSINNLRCKYKQYADLILSKEEMEIKLKLFNL
tara:strand:- start:1880 stop:2734 length:855 start_codon:yes stop_codon:yes gene_type:complete